MTEIAPGIDGVICFPDYGDSYFAQFGLKIGTLEKPLPQEDFIRLIREQRQAFNDALSRFGALHFVVAPRVLRNLLAPLMTSSGLITNAKESGFNTVAHTDGNDLLLLNEGDRRSAICYRRNGKNYRCVSYFKTSQFSI